jgi:exopolysaccharide biosynthesis polyprenyl glycosylphosphotransferase
VSIETFTGPFAGPLGGPVGPGEGTDMSSAGPLLGGVVGRRTVSRISPRTRQALRRQLWLVPVVVTALVAAAIGTDPTASAVALGVWASHHLLTDRWWLRATCPALSADAVRGAAWPLLVTAMAVAVGWAPTAWLAPAVVVGAVAAALQVLAVVLCRRVAGPPRVLVVGDPASTGDLVTRWAGQADVVITACVPLDERVPDLALDRRVDAVVVVPSAAVSAASVRRLGWMLEAAGVSLVVGTSLDFVAPHRLSVTRLAGATFVDVASSRPAAHVRALKVLLDRLGALVLLVLLGPLLLLLMACVRLDSPGPAIFSQTRIGRDGREFRLYKLRTMHRRAEEERQRVLHLDEAGGVLFKIRDDPRTTRVGRWLRRSSLDELPQLVNVLRGHMSLVGPRPALPDEVATYDDTTRRRLVVRPGMTGLWQVSGRSDLDWETAVALDVGYCDNVTVGGDLGICLRTVRAVVSARGAY